MMKLSLLAAVFLAGLGPSPTPATVGRPVAAANMSPYSWLQSSYDARQTVAARFSPPAGCQRVATTAGSFGYWLRYLPLRPAGTAVRLYDGRLKTPQTVHAAVVDIDTGTQDLQQCADAVIRLRAEYLFTKNPALVHFHFTSGHDIRFADYYAGKGVRVSGDEVKTIPKAVERPTHAVLRRYLNVIFSYAGTRSLAKETSPVPLAQVQAGDVLIQGGSPGHAVIVVDVARNAATGQRYMLLAQSYMPAQNIHLLRNHLDRQLGAWFAVDPSQAFVETPEWTFTVGQLQRF